MQRREREGTLAHCLKYVLIPEGEVGRAELIRKWGEHCKANSASGICMCDIYCVDISVCMTAYFESKMLRAAHCELKRQANL